MFKKKLSACAPSGFSMAGYGPGGVGKTSLMASLPPEETLYIEIEGGGDVLSGLFDPIVERPAKPSKKSPNAFKSSIEEIYSSLRNTKHNIKYVIIDSASEMEKYFQLGLAMAAGKELTSLKEYGGASELTYKYLVQFRDLKFAENNEVKRPINTIFICGEIAQEVLRSEDQTITKMYPLLTRKLAIKVIHLLDVIFRLEMTTTQERLLRFLPTRDIEAKTRYALRNMSPVTQSFNFYEKVVKLTKQSGFVPGKA